jgi:hypothetical protein
MTIHLAGSIVRVAISLTLLATVSGCASNGATRTISTLAGSSAGAAAGKAIGASGPWGYVATIASSAVGGFAGNQVARLFGANAIDQQNSALIDALNATDGNKAVTWGASDGKAPGGFAQATGPTFASATGNSCRSFMLVNYKQGGILGSIDPSAMKNGIGAIKDAKSSANKLSDINNVGDAVSGAKNAAEAVDKTQEVVQALTPGETAAATTPAIPVSSESFGTACKDAKGAWTVVKAKA